jgi:hypothetical protein
VLFFVRLKILTLHNAELNDTEGPEKYNNTGVKYWAFFKAYTQQMTHIVMMYKYLEMSELSIAKIGLIGPVHKGL